MPHDERLLPRLALALALCVLAGICLAGLAFPVLGTAGLAGKSAADDFLRLPSKLDTPTLAQRSRILDRDGHLIATLFTENRVGVTLHDVPKAAQQALIAIEDSRFYEHRGIDLKGTLRAVARNSSTGSVQQGGSTLTQQYVKNVLIESARSRSGQEAARERSVHRKLQEARYALALEGTMTKDQILEGYLNIAYYGNGVYGIGTAAAHYWGIPVSQLSLAQGALLAGMVQNPRRFDPENHPKEAVRRRNTVLLRMRDLGYLSTDQAVRASRTALGLHVTGLTSGCEAPGVTAPFFCDYVRRYLEDGPAGAALGATRQERQETLLAGGLTIRTTLDPKVQRSAQRAVDAQVPRRDPFGAAAVADVVQPGSGAVRAMAVDRGFGSGKGETKVNLALGGSLGYQGGSTFKAFTLAAAMQMHLSPGLTLNAPRNYCPRVYPYRLADGGCPGNAGDSESGAFTLTRATWESVNTFYLQLAERTGLDAPIELATAMGVRRLDGSWQGAPFDRLGSFVLGAAGGVSPLSMAAAYATFAARGEYCPPNPIDSVVDSQGKRVALQGKTCSQVMDRDAADLTTSILRGVIDGPVAARTGKAASIGRPAAGKTGTTNDSKAAWFVGYTPQLATAVWVGKPTPTPMLGISINGTYYKAVYGGSLPAPIWRDVMRGALEGEPVADFAAPPHVDAAPTLPLAPLPARHGGGSTPVPVVITPSSAPPPRPTRNPKPGNGHGHPHSSPPPSPPPSPAPTGKPSPTPS